jgi:hypothetical protein
MHHTANRRTDCASARFPLCKPAGAQAGIKDLCSQHYLGRSIGVELQAGGSRLDTWLITRPDQGRQACRSQSVLDWMRAVRSKYKCPGVGKNPFHNFSAFCMAKISDSPGACATSWHILTTGACATSYLDYRSLWYVWTYLDFRRLC